MAFRDLPCLTHVWAGAGHSKYTFKECKILKEPLQIITNRKIDKREQVTSRSIELSFLLTNRHLPSRFEGQASPCCRSERATKVDVLEYTCAGWHKLLDPWIPVPKKWRLREEVEENFHGVLA